MTAKLILGLLTGTAFILFIVSLVFFFRWKVKFKERGDVLVVRRSELLPCLNNQPQSGTGLAHQSECFAEPRAS